jgi:hypothetical protein
MNLQEAQAKWRLDRGHLEQLGIHLNGVQMYMPDEFRQDFRYALDAQPQLTAAAVGGIPAYLTTMMDPEVTRILLTPTLAAEALGEQKRGTWLDDSVLFPMLEHAGEVSSYGDWNNNGNVSVNPSWTQRQSYLFQTVKQYGDREVERADRGQLDWVAELDRAAADVMQRFLNTTYLYGVSGIQNYGLLNGPDTPASITPSLKAYAGGTGTAWTVAGVPMATPNEVYNDIYALISQLITQSAGIINQRTPMVLIMSPEASAAMGITNSFGVSVADLLKKNFPNIRAEAITMVEFGARTALNSTGYAAGNLMMVVASAVNGQKTGFSAFNEKMRSHPPVRSLSAVQQKVTGGSWGTIIRVPFAVASMVGI